MSIILLNNEDYQRAYKNISKNIPEKLIRALYAVKLALQNSIGYSRNDV